jgi:hypothetical protein
VVIELWEVEAFCLTPLIACLFFVVGVFVYVGEASAQNWRFIVRNTHTQDSLQPVLV